MGVYIVKREKSNESGAVQLFFDRKSLIPNSSARDGKNDQFIGLIE